MGSIDPQKRGHIGPEVSHETRLCSHPPERALVLSPNGARAEPELGKSVLLHAHPEASPWAGCNHVFLHLGEKHPPKVPIEQGLHLLAAMKRQTNRNEQQGVVEWCGGLCSLKILSTKRLQTASRWVSWIWGGCPKGRRARASAPLAPMTRHHRSALRVGTPSRCATSILMTHCAIN